MKNNTKDTFEPPAQPGLMIIAEECFSNDLGYMNTQIKDIEARINQVNQLDPVLLRTHFSYNNR